MEGGLLIHAAWALSFVFVWVYRRWFEKTGPRLPEFEAFCAERPLLAALSVRRGGEEAALRALRALLPRNETIATFGAWPWVHHVLSVECSARPGVVYASITGCRVLRTAEARPPSLTQGLVAVLADGGAVEQVWLHPRAYVDVSGRSSGEHGWRIITNGTEKRPCSEWHELPGWAQLTNSNERSLASSAALLPAAT
jgi:hypothetical protein